MNIGLGRTTVAVALVLSLAGWVNAPQATTAELEASAEATEVTDLNAVVAGSNLSVSGTASFADVPMTVARDAAADVDIAGIGTDVTALKIGRPQWNQNNLVFTMDIADQLPAPLYGIPELVHHFWHIRVTSQNDTSDDYVLQAWRTAQGAKAGADPVLRLLTCSSASCSVRKVLTGAMAGGVVSFEVPAGAIKAVPGASVGAPNTFAQAGADFGVSGVVNPFDGTLEFVQGISAYEVPQAVVRLGAASADTPDHLVPLTGLATLTSTGSFSGTLPAPTDPGDYKLVAQACYGAGNCGSGSTSFTI